MEIKIEKEFKNGKKLIAVTREITTYFKVSKDEEGTEVQERNTIDTIRDDSSYTGLTKEVWKGLEKIME